MFVPRQRDQSSSSTSAQLVRAATRLFADKGFEATSVGEIEAAVGLEPRRGTLYKHFASKADLLAAVVDARAVEANAFLTVAKTIHDLDFSALNRTELAELIRDFGSGFLDQLDNHRDLTRILEHDGDRLSGLKKRIRKEVIAPGHRAATQTLKRIAPPDTDAGAHAALLLTALTGLRRTAWTFGAESYPVNDARALDAWTIQCILLLRPQDHAGLRS